MFKAGLSKTGKKIKMIDLGIKIKHLEGLEYNKLRGMLINELQNDYLDLYIDVNYDKLRDEFIEEILTLGRAERLEQAENKVGISTEWFEFCHDKIFTR